MASVRFQPFASVLLARWTNSRNCFASFASMECLIACREWLTEEKELAVIVCCQLARKITILRPIEHAFLLKRIGHIEEELDRALIQIRRADTGNATRPIELRTLDRNDPLDDRWQERRIRQIEIDLPSPLSRSDREVFIPTERAFALLLLPSSSSSFYSRLKKSFNFFHSRHWFYWKLSHNWNGMN